MKALWVAVAFVALATSMTVVLPSRAADTGCQAAVPASLAATPTRWLGECRSGRAEGLGVLRAGGGEPYQFFFGLMHGGVPVKGLLRVRDGWEDAARFDGARHNIETSNPNEFHALYVLATRAALATAQRFAAAGNRGSAAYYQRLAKQIRDGEPE